MRGHDDRPALRGRSQRVDDLRLGIVIQMRGRLVEHPQISVAQERTGDRDPAGLPGRQALSALTQLGV